MKLFLLLTFLSLSTCQKFSIPDEAAEKGNQFWMSNMKAQIGRSLMHTENHKVAKNVIIFIGDGMGVTVNTAGRLYKGQKAGHSGEETVVAWEQFTNLGLLKTYCLDKQVPDSASTATALFGGVKGNYYTVGVTGAVARADCEASLVQENRVQSILSWAQDAKKDTGFVTTTRATHATPAALYAHTPERQWECDTMLEDSVRDAGCKDIAAQMVESLPGLNINVVLAGGRNQFGAALPSDDDSSCKRADGRNLVNEWLADKTAKGLSSQYVTNTKELVDADVEKLDHIIGLFSGGHMPYELERDTSPEGTPSISQMTESAIKRLKRSSNGYVLMVEGGRIDHALHDNLPKKSLEEFVALDEAVATALRLVADDDETLVMVTADHSHVMTMNGYPERGNHILGLIEENDALDEMPYPTLMFTNGPGANFTYDTNGKTVLRQNLTGVNTTGDNFVSPALVKVPVGYETHGGEDVAIYAKGPMAHLVQKVHEQSYTAHVIGYAACIGPYEDDCDKGDRGASGLIRLSVLLYSLCLATTAMLIN